MDPLFLLALQLIIQLTIEYRYEIILISFAFWFLSYPFSVFVFFMIGFYGTLHIIGK